MNAIARFSLFVLLIGAPFAVNAQTQRSGDANARAMQQLQQLSAERVQLKTENEKLQQELQALKAQIATTTATQASLQQRLKAAEATAARDLSAQSNAEAERLRSQMQELVTRFRETAQSLKDVEADRNVARTSLQASERELTTCVTRNKEFYQLNSEVLDRLENKNAWNSLTAKEPFTQLQRTRLENLIEGYKDRATDLRVQPVSGPSNQAAK